MFISSDWHLGGSLDAIGSGGRPTLGTSIFRSVGALTGFIDWVAEISRKGADETELVINGDMVDFLAPDPDDDYEPIAWQPDARIICDRLDSIAKKNIRSDGRGPFEALRDLTAAGCHLTILLGNHDIELSLPAVRDHFVQLVSGSRNGVRFIHDGEAYHTGNLLIEHGNRYDKCNAIEFDRLRQERSRLSRVAVPNDLPDSIRRFEPPVGSSVVIDQVNPRLDMVPFYNLIKPELSVAIPLMLAFYPETRNFWHEAYQGIRMLWNQRNHSYKVSDGYTAAQSAPLPETLNRYLRSTLGSDAEFFVGPNQTTNQTAAKGKVVERIQERLSTLAAKGRDLTCLRDIYHVAKAKNDEERLQAIRIALRRVDSAKPFLIDRELPEYLDPAKEMLQNEEINVVVFGHTHYPKAVAVSGGHYFNCGTWADVMQVPTAIFSSDNEEADRVIDIFLSDIAEMKYRPYTLRACSYVDASIAANGAVNARLMQFDAEVDQGIKLNA